MPQQHKSMFEMQKSFEEAKRLFKDSRRVFLNEGIGYGLALYHKGEIKDAAGVFAQLKEENPNIEVLVAMYKNLKETIELHEKICGMQRQVQHAATC